jgi:phosphoglycolate phosphatase-like HAD superfamily hydrolase
VNAEPMLVIFDIDGTLVDSTAVHHAALTTALLGIGLDPRSKPWSAFRHYTDSGVLDELYRDVRGVGATAAELARLDTAMHHEFASAALGRPVAEIAGARRLLKELDEAGVLFGFATGSMRGAAALKLLTLGLDPQAQILVTASEYLSREDIVRQVLAEGDRRLGCSFNAVLLGDGLWDERVAQSLNMALVGVETGLHVFGSGADLVVPDLTQLTPMSLRAIARPMISSNRSL